MDSWNLPPGGPSEVLATVFDSEGNLYLTGTIAAGLDPHSVHSISSSSNSTRRATTSKSFGGPEPDRPYAIEVSEGGFS
jgi:hypothetical protein